MTVTPTERPAWAAPLVKLSRWPGVWPAASLALIAVLVLTSATTSLARTGGAQPANPQAQTVEFTFTSTYDGSTQQAVMQVPAAYQPCLLYTSPSPRDRTRSRMPSSA